MMHAPGLETFDYTSCRHSWKDVNFDRSFRPLLESAQYLRAITIRVEPKKPSSSGTLLIEIPNAAFKSACADAKHLDDPLRHMVLPQGTFLRGTDANRTGLVAVGVSPRKHVKASDLATEWREGTPLHCSPLTESKLVDIDTIDFKPLLTSLAGVSGNWDLFVEVDIGIEGPPSI
ncbi:hypothetical protein BKA70DRAFT_1428903 [Coprinopsis sp. MPI-PUGE-AT-0042]|nr:hypothetical protein BKA70DRAFT_1428903 [Coprinopsis sp. MPI-PUGE-AT-0042]